MLNVPPLKSIWLLLLVAYSVPILEITPPLSVSRLLEDRPLPMTTLLFIMFQNVPPSLTVTVLLDEPAPMVKPPIQTVALVTIIWL